MPAAKQINDNTPTLWGIHAGKTGDADTLFLKKKCVALGWAKMGNLSSLKDRDAFKEAVAKAYPESKPGAIPNNAGQLFRFVHEMKSDRKSTRLNSSHLGHLVCRLLLEKKNKNNATHAQRTSHMAAAHRVLCCAMP